MKSSNLNPIDKYHHTKLKRKRISGPNAISFIPDNTYLMMMQYQTPVPFIVEIRENDYLYITKVLT